VVQVLLDAGADQNVGAKNVEILLQAAARNGHDKVVQMLLNPITKSRRSPPPSKYSTGASGSMG